VLVSGMHGQEPLVPSEAMEFLTSWLQLASQRGLCLVMLSVWY